MRKTNTKIHFKRDHFEIRSNHESSKDERIIY